MTRSHGKRLLGFGALCWLAACGHADPEDKGRSASPVVGGTEPIETPAQLGIPEITSPPERPGEAEGIGSGVFIDNTTILTAKHVVGYARGESIKIRLGSIEAKGIGQPVRHDRLDAAILKTSTPFTINGSGNYVRPISTLKATEVLSNPSTANVVCFGYGETAQGGVGLGTLRAGTLDVVAPVPGFCKPGPSTSALDCQEVQTAAYFSLFGGSRGS